MRRAPSTAAIKDLNDSKRGGGKAQSSPRMDATLAGALSWGTAAPNSTAHPRVTSVAAKWGPGRRATGVHRSHCSPDATAVRPQESLLWRAGAELATAVCSDGHGGSRMRGRPCQQDAAPLPRCGRAMPVLAKPSPRRPIAHRRSTGGRCSLAVSAWFSRCCARRTMD